MKRILKWTSFIVLTSIPYFSFSQSNDSHDIVATRIHVEEKENSFNIFSGNGHSNATLTDPIPVKDEQLPKFSFSQDIYQLHLNFKKEGIKFSAVDFIVYMDIDNDRKLILNEPAIRFSWNGGDEKFAVEIYNYIPAAKNGDVLGEHNAMPGKLAYRKSIENLSKISLNGENIEVSVPFMYITRVTGIVILDQLQFDEKFKFRVASANKMMNSSSRTLIPGNVQSIAQLMPSIVLYNFTVTPKNNKNYVEWAIKENETAEHFEVEKSYDGKKFSTAALVFTSEKEGDEMYKFYEFSEKVQIFYRLKMYGKDLKTEYSQILVLKKN
jgi:hypothetical protein